MAVDPACDRIAGDVDTLRIRQRSLDLYFQRAQEQTGNFNSFALAYNNALSAYNAAADAANNALQNAIIRQSPLSANDLVLIGTAQSAAGDLRNAQLNIIGPAGSYTSAVEAYQSALALYNTAASNLASDQAACAASQPVALPGTADSWAVSVTYGAITLEALTAVEGIAWQKQPTYPF